MTETVVVAPEDAGARLDAFASRVAGLSRAVIQRAIADGEITVDGSRVAKSLRLEPGMRVEIAIPASTAQGPQAEAIEVPIAYSDEHLVVVAKPAGMVVHPAPGHAGGTLVNALLARADDVPSGGEDDERPGIVHRLDAGTSGLMVVAKTEQAHARLIEMMAARLVTRIYLALVEGAPDAQTLTIDAPVGRSNQHRKKMAVVAGGKTAITHVEVIERFARTSLVRARLDTGRTHQIRVHLEAIEHPVVGDPIYGHSRALARELGLDRPFLHAAHLAFAHPITGEALDFEEPLPRDLAEALARAELL